MANKEIEVTIQNDTVKSATTVSETAVAVIEETTVAEVPEDSNPNRIKLSHPYEWEGGTIDHIDVDLQKVSGRDCKTIMRMLESTGEVNPMAVLPEFSIPYILQLVAYASRIPVEFMECLEWPDVMKLKVKVISFFGA